MDNRKIITGLIAVMLSASMMATGCTPQKKPTPNPNAGMNQVRRNVYRDVYPDARNIAPAPTPTPVVPTPRNEARARDAADEIADRVAQVNGVERAYTVVVGNVALIGLDLDADVEKGATEKIRERCANIAKKDPRIVRSIVETDPDAVARLRKMAEGVREGRPISEFFDQITEMFNRAKPSAE